MTGTDDMNRLIRDAFRELCSEEYRPHEEAPAIPVSFPFHLYMEELLDERSKRALWFRRIRWSSLIGLVILAVMIFSVMLARNPPESEGNPGFSHPAGVSRPDEYLFEMKHDYYFTTLPETYERIDREESDAAFRERWSDGAHTLERWQSRIGWRSWQATQLASEETVTVNGRTARVCRLKPASKGAILLQWSNEYYYMELYLQQVTDASPVTAEQLVQWAEGLRPVELYEPEPDEASGPQE